MDKNMQKNPERTFSQHCEHPPVSRNDRLTLAVQESQGRRISYILLFLIHPPSSLLSRQELTGIYFSFLLLREKPEHSF